ncbi:MAG: hypothetical protein MJ252_04905, partial [archaeon]|nr:hypothetical protein [archaeon]
NEINIMKDNKETKNNTIKRIEEENNNKNKEIERLKKNLSDCNNNIILISNTNESIIKDKDTKIEELNNKIKEQNNKIKELSEGNKSKNIPNNLRNDDSEKEKEIEKLKEELNTFKNLSDNYKLENKEIKNKIAQIKVEYLSKKDEDIEELKRQLIKINDDAGNNLSKYFQIKEKNQKSNDDLNRTQNSNSPMDLTDITNKIKIYSNEVDKVNKELEQKISLINIPIDDVTNDYFKLKKENEKLKNMILNSQVKDFLSNRSDRKGRNNRVRFNENEEKTLSNLNDPNMEDELSSISGIYIDDMKNNCDNTTNTIKKDSPNKDENNPTEDNKTTNINEDVSKLKNVISDLEKSESNLKNKLNSVSEEMNKLNKENTELKKKAQLSTEIDNNCLEKIETLNQIKQNFEKLVYSIQLVGKVKEYVNNIFKLIGYSDEDIQKC